MKVFKNKYNSGLRGTVVYFESRTNPSPSNCIECDREEVEAAAKAGDVVEEVGIGGFSSWEIPEDWRVAC